MTTPTPDRQWAITVTIPAHVDHRDSLFQAVADAAYEWEPPVRDGWDIEVSGCPVEDLAAEVAALRTAVHDLGCFGQVGPGHGPGHRYDGDAARRMANAWGGAYGWSPATVDAVRRALTEDTPDTPTDTRQDRWVLDGDRPNVIGLVCGHEGLPIGEIECRGSTPEPVAIAAALNATPPDTELVCATCNDTRKHWIEGQPEMDCPDCTEDTP